MPRRRLDHVDAMRPIKQAGVISTHSVQYFAPAAAFVASNAALLLLHVSREGFFFISACMLTYAYADMRVAGLRRFYWRRFVAVAIPYACWTLIYFWYPWTAWHYRSLPAQLKGLATIAYTGYEQLYFLLVIMQFYLVFPLVLMLLRWTRNHHVLLIAAAAVAQVGLSIAMHWNLLPPLMLKWEQQDSLSYLLYLIGGAVVAFHLDEVHDWVCRHVALIVGLTLLAALAAEAVYFLAQDGVTTVLGSGSDPFQPSVIPFNVGAITCGYLAGVALVRRGRSRPTKAFVRSASDNAYGIYLTQMLFISWLSWHHWAHLDSVVPWPLVVLLTVLIVFVCGIALTSLLARTPLAVPLTGRTQQPWSTLIPRRWRAAAPRHGSDATAIPSPVALPPALSATAMDPAADPAADPATDRAIGPAEPVPGALAGVTSEGNGA